MWHAGLVYVRYGYSFGAAKADVWHKWDEYSMIYPGYVPSGLGELQYMDGWPAARQGTLLFLRQFME